jgi:hypothetical protein
MSFGELQISFLLFSAPEIPQMRSYPAASRANSAKKKIKTSFFTIEIHYISSISIFLL